MFPVQNPSPQRLSADRISLIKAKIDNKISTLFFLLNKVVPLLLRFQSLKKMTRYAKLHLMFRKTHTKILTCYSRERILTVRQNTIQDLMNLPKLGLTPLLAIDFCPVPTKNIKNQEILF